MPARFETSEGAHNPNHVSYFQLMEEHQNELRYVDMPPNYERKDGSSCKEIVITLSFFKEILEVQEIFVLIKT